MPSGDTRFCHDSTIGAFRTQSTKLTANAIQVSRHRPRTAFCAAERDSSINCWAGVSGRGAHQRETPQIKMNTHRNDN